MEKHGNKYVANSGDITVIFIYSDDYGKTTKEVTQSFKEDIDVFVGFYNLNNSLRYCNGSYYKFKDEEWENKYKQWLKSDEYKKMSFNLFYGNGIVD